MITAPEANLGDVLGSLNQRRGQVETADSGLNLIADIVSIVTNPRLRHPK